MRVQKHKNKETQYSSEDHVNNYITQKVTEGRLH